MCLRDWIEPKRSREAGPGLSRGWQVHWGVNCLGVQWVYSDHIQRAFSSRSFKSKCVKGARGGICINGISWGLWDRGALENEEKRNHPPPPEIRKVSPRSQVPFDSWALPKPCPSPATLPLEFFEAAIGHLLQRQGDKLQPGRSTGRLLLLMGHLCQSHQPPQRVTQGPRVEVDMMYSGHHRETTGPVSKSPLRP